MPLGLLFVSCLDLEAATTWARQRAEPGDRGSVMIAPLGSAEVSLAIATQAAAVPPPPAPAPQPDPANLPLPVESEEDAWGELDDEPAAPSQADEAAELAPAEEQATESGDGDGPPVLASIGQATWILAEPKKKSRKIGYLRAGAVVTRSAEPVSGPGCKNGYYRVEPEGYVCRGKSVTFDRFHPVVEALARRPDRGGLPFDYVTSRAQTPVLYGRIPTQAEQRAAEPDLAHHLRKHRATQRDKDFVPLPEPGPVPNVLLYGRPAPGLFGDKPRSDGDVVLGKAGIRSGFALIAQFEEDGRRFGLTTELAVLPLDRTRWVRPSSFEGIRLDEEVSLPVAFVLKRRATRYAKDEHGRMVAGAPLGHREAVPLKEGASGTFLEATDGSFVRAEDVRQIPRMTRRPTWASPGRRWIDVSLLRQSLVAYEGDRPVFATLVSTGAGGIGDPKETHATIQGVFLIHTKHVTATMDGDDAGDEFDLRDVPFVQYSHEGFALHAAYWHDDFGTPRSHGCVNLAPKDAAFLFGFTTPEVPEAWHAALSLRRGTVVYTHP